MKLENPELKKLLRTIGRDSSPEEMIAVLKLCAESRFLVPTSTVDGRTGIHAVSDSKGRRFLAAYSDTASYETAMVDAGREVGPVVDACFDDLLDAVLNDSFNLDGFILNPGTGDIMFGKDTLRTIRGGNASVLSDFRVGTPSAYPPRMLSMISEFASLNPALTAVYVKLAISRSSDSDMRWLMAVESSLTGDELKYMLDTFGRFMKPYLDGMSAMVGSVSDSYLAPAVSGEKPFWEKK